MRTIIALTLLLAAVAAAEQPKQPAKLTNEERLMLENLSLRAALAKQQFERIQEEQQTTVKAICSRAGIDPGNCQIDPQTLTVQKREEAKK